MIEKVALNRYKITPIGWEQHALVFVFWVTGSITIFGDILMTKNRKLVRWFK